MRATTTRRPTSSASMSTAARRVSLNGNGRAAPAPAPRRAGAAPSGGFAASVAVSASAEERQSSSCSSSGSPSESPSSAAREIAAVLSSSPSKSPLALAAVGALGAASTTPFGSALFASIVGGGNGGGWWKGGGGGGGGDGRGSGGGDGNDLNPSVSDLAAKDDDDDDDEEEEEGGEDEEEGTPARKSSAAAAADEDDDDEEEDDDDDDDEPASKRKKRPSSAVSSEPVNAFYVSKVVAHGLPTGLGVPTEEELFEGGSCQPGLPATRVDVANDLSRLVGTGMFGNVDAKVTQAPGKKKGECVVEFTFHEKQWPSLKSFRVVSTSSKQGPAIPYSEVAKVMDVASGETGIRRLAAIRSIVDGWYQRHGYAPHCHIVRFDGLSTGDVTAVVAEPRVERVRVTPIDDYGQPLPASSAIVKPHVVLRELPFRRGEPYNQGVDARKALRNVYATGCFDDVQIVPNPLDHEGDKLEVIVFVRERPAKTADLDLEWQVAPNDAGKPGLVTPFPGGSITYEDRNVRGVGATASASLTSANLLSPGDDLGFRVEGKWPYFRGPRDPRRGALTLAAFNGRKVSPVFSGGPGEDVPPVFVDRVGAKVALQETYSRNSHGSVGIVLEQVTARDEAGAVAPRGTKQLATGALAPLGPPTTLSDSGRDVVAYLQGALVRDATWDCGGQTVGPRDSATVEQGVFIGGGGSLPLFNRATLSMTRHLRLPSSLGGKIPLQLPERIAPRPSLAGPRPPASLVLHARGGAAVGPLPSYEAFSLGGPHSARGYNVGELSTARRFVEAAAELRVPVARATAFAFVEGAHDLGSSSEVSGDPAAFYRRPGAGTSCGFGAKMGAMRLEYATDNNAGRGSVFMRYGERF